MLPTYKARIFSRFHKHSTKVRKSTVNPLFSSFCTTILYGKGIGKFVIVKQL